MTHRDVIEAVQADLAEFAATAVARLPLYRHLANRAAGDADVAALLLHAAPDDRFPTLLLASVHDRLLVHLADGGPDAAVAREPLGAWYPSITDDPRPVGHAGDDPWPHFRRLALEDPAVAHALATRGTQTNEVGRCATTLPALHLVLRDVDRPIGLVEVGTSAGLNLRLDRYGYRWSGPEDDAHVLHPGAAVQVTSAARGPAAAPAPTEVPPIEHRAGVDRHPVDLTDPTAARWLVACQWPEQTERLARCRSAVAAAVEDPPPVQRGDLLEAVVPLVQAIPEHCHPVVLSTWTLAYLSVDGQRAFLAALDRAAEERDLTLLLQEEPSAAPGLDLPPRPDRRPNPSPGPTALCRVDWRAGRRTTEVRLADQHPHGTWVEWFT